MLRLVYAVCLAFSLVIAGVTAPVAQGAPAQVRSAWELYTFEADGQQYGPFSKGAVIDRIVAGESTRDTLIWSDASDDWVLITSDPELAAAVDGASTTVAQPLAPKDQPAQPTTLVPTMYWVFDNGRQIGPMYDTDVLDRIAEGESGHLTLVWSEGFADWAPIGTMAEFAAALPPLATLYWVFEGSGDPVGPLSLEQVAARIGTRDTTRDTMVWMEGLADWADIETIPELDEILPVDVAQAGGDWFIYEFEVQRGPIREADLLADIAAGNIGRSALVWQAGMPEWVSIEAVPLFEEAMADPIEIEKPYYVIEEGERLGPLTDSEIRIRILDGLSTADDLAWKKGLPDWTPLSEFPELADAVAAASPPPMPDADEPPPMPGEDEPPAMPGEDGIEILTDGDHVFEGEPPDLRATLERWAPTVLSTATNRERDQAIVCMLEALVPLDAASRQMLVDTGMGPSESQADDLLARYPGVVDAMNACIAEASEMKDLFDALLWDAADDATPDSGGKIAIYACLRQATERLSQAHRDRLAAEGMKTSNETVAMMEREYPGLGAEVEACEALADAPIAPPIDEPAQPEVPDQPQQPDQPDQPDQPQPPEEDAFTQTIRKQVAPARLPDHLEDQMVRCMVNVFAVLSEAERQAVIANPDSQELGMQMEAAHPGISDKLMQCAPRI